MTERVLSVRRARAARRDRDPARGPPRRAALCVLVNAGMVAKSGPWRLYVEVARRLAHAGVATLRFDLGGIGDSRREHGRRAAPGAHRARDPRGHRRAGAPASGRPRRDRGRRVLGRRGRAPLRRAGSAGDRRGCSSIRSAAARPAGAGGTPRSAATRRALRAVGSTSRSRRPEADADAPEAPPRRAAASRQLQVHGAR